ncbi:hypothetical protein [Nannocystis pusilla]|uniref:hypothetical protein n=1 Tax=Nannocystis pusilla TaxID=889268 RepID=UPI003BF338BB
MDHYQGRTCEAGIASHLIHVHAANNDQYMNQWCWAACISMIFGYYGHIVSQHRIVQECYGSIINMPAQPHTILGALNRPWIDDAGNHFSAISGNGISVPELMAQDLAADCPLILGTQGHAMVMTAIKYGAPWVATPWGPRLGPTQVMSATVRDPWPGRGKRILRADEWYQVMFAAHIRVF